MTPSQTRITLDAESPLSRRLRLHAEALAEAEVLRRAALADFWRGTDALLASGVQQALRSSERLRQRLQRRAPPAPLHPQSDIQVRDVRAAACDNGERTQERPFHRPEDAAAVA